MQYLRLGSLLLLATLFFASCATYKTRYHSSVKNWESELPQRPEQPLEHRLYLVGDAGYKSYASPALLGLREKLQTEEEESTIVFLGDNIYPGGLPPADSASERLEAEKILLAQMELLEMVDGRGYFVCGNHDYWYYKTRGVRRQEDFINAYMNKGLEDEDDWEDYFLPKNGCPDPEVVEITDNLVLIAINSQWWLSNWRQDPDINYDCDVKTREAFMFWFEEALRKHRNKNVVVTLHHPLYTYGPHGGNFTIKEHIFPLTELEDNLYIPLPVLGTLGVFMRGTIGLRQDVANPVYRELKEGLLGAAKKNGNFIFASGHEHTLQYIEQDNQFFIVSGAGSKRNPVTTGKGSQFSSGSYGFAQLDVYKDGTTWVTYWGAEKGKKGITRLYEKQIKGKLPLATSFPEKKMTFPEEIPPVKRTEITTRDIKSRGGFYTFFYGEHYRDLYRDTFELPTVLLDTLAGGLFPVKVGGGGQTNSLRLENAEAQQYVMRSTTKDASRFIPYPFNKITSVKSLVEETFLAAHPFAAVAIPPMSEACNIYHTDPKLYYIPKQPALKEYNELFGDEVYLVERRPDEDVWKNAASFGNPDDIIGTDDVIENLRKSEKHIVDQPWVLRSRLFDHLIGDWDRHDDQWRWAVFEQKNDVRLYRPIPRDRDQAFCQYDGLVGGFSRMAMPFLRQLRNYKPEIGNIKWSTYNGRQFDKAFLNQLSWEEWQRQVRFLQENLTDAVIEKGFDQWPVQLQNEKTEEIKAIMRYRRDHLMELARQYYEHLAKEVEITGTNDPDLFLVTREDETTTVAVWELDDGEPEDKIFERTFINDETREIRLYGFEDEDRFELNGEASKGIRIRIIGGEDEDIVADRSRVRGWGKKTKVYDTKTGNILDLGREAKDLTSDQSNLNLYHRRDPHYEYDFIMPLPTAGFNPDDGVFLGASISYTSFGYKKNPYAQRHTLKGDYAFATGAYSLGYQGEFIEAVGNWDLLLEANAEAPRFVINYFGYGNETENLEKDDFDFNRIRRRRLQFQPALRSRFSADKGKLTFGGLIEQIDVEKTPDRFVSSDNSGLREQVFNPQGYGGLFGQLDFENVNHLFLPTKGVKLSAGVRWMRNLERASQSFANFHAQLAFYQSLERSERLVLASKLGWARNTGRIEEDFEFFQAVRLGGHGNLRGYREHRFYGREMFFHNTDLRFEILSSEQNPLAQASIGILAGFDYGRVWVEGEDSDKWHTGYGGGIWLAPVDFFVFVGELFYSEDGERFTLGLQFTL